MSRFRAYIKPFDENGNYADWIEVTEDIDFNSMGRIKQKVDQDEYNVGVLRFANFNLKLANDDGAYSDVTESRSIFRYKRAESLFRVTWQKQDFPTECGIAVCGAVIAGNLEYELFQGLINDEATTVGVQEQDAQFKVLGLESIFDKVDVPFASINNGDLISEVIYTILNQTAITTLMTVDASNISVATDVTIDDKSDWENKTVKECLDDLLLWGNAVLYIKDNVVYVSARTPTASVQNTFYGQASNDGIEDIQDLSKIKTGLSQAFNYWTWEGTTILVQDSSSVAKNGIRKKQISGTQITDSGKRTTILTGLRDEFSTPKQVFDLTSTLTIPKVDLFILDKVSVDYPTVYKTAEGAEFPLYGVAIYGQAKYPVGEWSVTIDKDDEFMILGREIDTKNQLLTYKIRKV